MKLTGWAAPLLVGVLVTVLLCGLAMLAVRASAFSTATSIELLRLQLRVVRLQDRLLARSRERLTGQAAPLFAAPPAGAPPAPADGEP
jgi:hypothetical protein